MFPSDDANIAVPAPLAPLYTNENCSFCCPLKWGLSTFWRMPMADDSWFGELVAATEPDGIRILGHRFSKPGISQFVISTQPYVAPQHVMQRVKGRLQYLIRNRLPKAWKGNYGIRSIGHVTRQTVEAYVASQLGHHPMADPRIQDRLRRFQIVRTEVDLSLARCTGSGRYWYNLHIVLVHRERWAEVREDVLQRIHDMILGASAAKGYWLSRAGILADHVHLALGCPIGVAPADVALGFLNNLAYAQGMRPVYQFGGYIGTFGEYTNHALRSETSLRPDEPGGGASSCEVSVS